MKKLIVTLILTIVTITYASIVVADEEPINEDGVDIMIIIDKSTSMGWNDPNLETLAATDHILNLSLGTNNRIGFVVYNDTILAYQGLEVIESSDQIDGIMSELRGLQRSRWTDAGLVLQTARRLLITSEYRPRRTGIIYLSDGVSRFTMDNPNRDYADVVIDVENVFESISYPIFMVAYSVEGNNQTFGDGWGERTGGADFKATTPDEMTQVVDEIYRLITEMALTNNAVQPVGGTRVYEHQLIIPIPRTETERAEMVEVTLKGEGLLQEVILPADHSHITMNVDGTNYIITFTDPERVSYVVYYFSTSEVPLENSMVTRMVEVRDERQVPWEMIGIETVGIVISSIVVLAILALLIRMIAKKHRLKKLYPALNGTLECYFMEIPTGVKDIPVQSWSASFLAGNKNKSLYKMLRNVPLRSRMPEAEKIFASINDDSTISIVNKAGIVCYKNGMEVKRDKITLRNGEGLYMVFKKNTIEVELRARKSSLS